MCPFSNKVIRHEWGFFGVSNCLMIPEYIKDYSLNVCVLKGMSEKVKKINFSCSGILKAHYF